MSIQKMEKAYATTTQNLYNIVLNEKKYFEMAMKGPLFYNIIHLLIALSNTI